MSAALETPVKVTVTVRPSIPAPELQVNVTRSPSRILPSARLCETPFRTTVTVAPVSGRELLPDESAEVTLSTSAYAQGMSVAAAVMFTRTVRT